MASGKSIPPEEFARFIVEDIKSRRTKPEFADIVTGNDANTEYVCAVAAIVSQILENQGIEIRAVGPSDLYSCEVDYSLDRGTLPFSIPSAPKNGKEDYILNIETAIKHITIGTVIDHIHAGKGAKIMGLLGLDKTDYQGRISLGVNYWSKKMGKKDFLKIESCRDLTQKELDLVAIVSQNATISSIRSGNVIDKKVAFIRPHIDGIALCPDLACKGDSNSYGNDKFTCDYCKKIYNAGETRID